jgi:hypothetical protein
MNMHHPRVVKSVFFGLIFAVITALSGEHAEAQTFWRIYEMEGGCKLIIDGYDLNGSHVYTAEAEQPEKMEGFSDHIFSRVRIARYYFGNQVAVDDYEVPGPYMDMVIYVMDCEVHMHVNWIK